MDKNECRIYYTTTNNKIINFEHAEIDAKIISHIYKDKGVITFDKQISKIRRAFTNCRTLVSITLPDSIKDFSVYSFSGCDNLQEFNHIFSSTDKRCLINSKGVLIGFAPGNITEYTVPSNVVQIGGRAFSYSKLTKINIPNSVQIIGSCAFQNCESLCEVIMDFGVIEICQSAFFYCKNLKHIVIPESLVKVGNCAFAGCKSLSGFDSNLATQDKRCLVIDGTLVAFAAAGLSDYTFSDEITSYIQTVFHYTGLQKRLQKVLDARINTNSLKNIISTKKEDSIVPSNISTKKDLCSQISHFITMEEQKCKWIKSGSNVTIQGLTLSRGNFYIGNYYKVDKHPRGIRYTSKDKIIIWATINPELSILKGDFRKGEYFLSYNDLSPEGRYIYISWLANLTPTKDVPDDILLLHICGLQVRLFLDIETSIEDKEDLIKYLINLKSELSAKSKISYYIDEVIDISLAKFFLGKANRFSLESFNFFRTYKYLNSTFFSKFINDSFNSDIIFETYTDLYSNSPLAKYKNYFTLFFEKNKKYFKLLDLGSKHKDIVQIPNRLPFNSYLYIKKDCNFCLFETINYSQHIVELIEKCFKKYNSDFLSFKQIYPFSIGQNSPLAYFSLPKYITEKETQIFLNFKERLETIIKDSVNIINYDNLAELFGIKCNKDFLTRPVIECIISGLKNLGYGIVPNIYVSYDNLINTKGVCVIYKYPKSLNLCIDQEFKLAEILCKLLAIIMYGTSITEQELTAIYNNLSKLTNNKHNILYLYSYFLWLSQRKNIFDKNIKQTLTTLSKSHKLIFMQVILDVIVTSDFIHNNRVLALNKILPLLDASLENVHSLIHKALADDYDFVKIDKTNNTLDNNTNTIQEVKLDINKLNKFREQTNESQLLLSKIFTTDNEEEYFESQNSGINIMKEILIKILDTDVWNYKDFSQLCNNYGVLPGSILEQINDYAYEVVDDVIAEEIDDKIYINTVYKDKLI